MDIAVRTIGEIVAGDYRVSKVFEKYGVDFCCGGNMVLLEACKKEGLDVSAITQEIEEITCEPVERENNYGSWEISGLVDFIIDIHHRYLKENLGRIKKHISKIAEVHGCRHPELSEVAAVFDAISRELPPHLKEEEDLFFPALKRIAGKSDSEVVVSDEDIKVVAGSLKNLGKDHEIIGEAIHRINHLTRKYEVPEDACNTYRTTCKELEAFGRDIHKHVHLENNILFFKAQKLIS